MIPRRRRQLAPFPLVFVFLLLLLFLLFAVSCRALTNVGKLTSSNSSSSSTSSSTRTTKHLYASVARQQRRNQLNDAIRGVEIGRAERKQPQQQHATTTSAPSSAHTQSRGRESARSKGASNRGWYEAVRRRGRPVQHSSQRPNVVRHSQQQQQQQQRQGSTEQQHTVRNKVAQDGLSSLPWLGAGRIGDTSLAGRLTRSLRKMHKIVSANDGHAGDYDTLLQKKLYVLCMSALDALEIPLQCGRRGRSQIQRFEEAVAEAQKHQRQAMKTPPGSTHKAGLPRAVFAKFQQPPGEVLPAFLVERIDFNNDGIVSVEEYSRTGCLMPEVSDLLQIFSSRHNMKNTTHAAAVALDGHVDFERERRAPGFDVIVPVDVSMLTSDLKPSSQSFVRVPAAYLLWHMYRKSASSEIRTVLAAALLKGLNINTVTTAVGSHTTLLVDIFDHSPEDVLLCKVLLQSGHDLSPILVHRDDVAAAALNDVRGKPYQAEGGGHWEPAFYGVSLLHLGAAYLERTITENLLLVKAEMQRPHLEGTWRDGSKFDSYSVQGAFRHASLLRQEQRRSRVRDVRSKNSFKSDLHDVFFRSMHVASPTFRELEKLWDRQEETLAPTNINNGEDHSDNISHRADSVNNGRWDLNPAGNSEVQPKKQNTTLYFGETTMLPRILTHAMDEELNIFLMRDALSTSRFRYIPEECGAADEKMYFGKDPPGQTRITASNRSWLNMASIALQTPPPTAVNPLHIYALQGKTKLLNTVMERIRFLAESAEVSLNMSSTVSPLRELVQHAFNQGEFLYDRTPLHIAAKLHGQDSTIWRSLRQWRQWAFRRPNDDEDLEARVDSEGMSALDYAACSISNSSCMLPYIGPNVSDSPVIAGEIEFLPEDLKFSNTDKDSEACPIFNFSDHPNVTTFSYDWDLAAEQHRKSWHSDGVREDLIARNYSRPSRLGFANEDVSSDCEVVSVFGLPSPADFIRYIDASKPVILRGAAIPLLGPKLKLFSKEEFLARYANDSVRIGDHPYPTQFGRGARGMQSVSMAEYINTFGEHGNNGSSVKYLWSVHFVAEHLQKVLDDVDSVYSFIKEIENQGRGIAMIPPDVGTPSIHLGPSGAGAPAHWHNLAINMLFFGRKDWLFYPPDQSPESYTPALELFTQTEPRQRRRHGIQPLKCMQREGDILLVPKHWSHATLNVESGISLAIFILDKYDSATSEAYVRSELKVSSNTSHVHSDVTRYPLTVFGQQLRKYQQQLGSEDSPRLCIDVGLDDCVPSQLTSNPDATASSAPWISYRALYNV